ncbi:MAG TPA: DUF6448 family protein [Bryobacteraceae bacterium]
MSKRVVTISLLATTVLFAHCDSLDGPVVQAARRAIASGEVNVVLPWVQPGQESTIRQAFLRTMSVRTLNTTAQELADTWFFETLVRIHRAGEGAPYEGLKPAGAEVSNAIRAADKALATGDLQPLEKTLTAAMHQGLGERFLRAQESKGYEPANVNAGRKYVAAYVDFIHFAERLEKSLTPVDEHSAEHVH